MIIFLNGSSSSGKSRLAREIMRQSMHPFIYYSIDHLVNYWMDEKFIAFESEPTEWFYHESSVDEQGNLLTHIVDGPNAVQLHWDMIEALSVLIKKGYDLIIDEVLWKPEIFERYCQALILAKKVYMIQVYCDLIESERREHSREDRFKGLARALHAQVYTTHPIHDLQIDTTYTKVPDCAKAILNFIENTQNPQGFLKSLHLQSHFQALEKKHFVLLQRWINSPQVAPWWGENKIWQLEDIEKKYGSYVKGYKSVEGINKPIKCYIIFCAQIPIGYIQYYNLHDFPRIGYEIDDFSYRVAGLDLYIGELEYTGKGLGPHIIEQFLINYVWPDFEACFVDADTANTQAITAYKKAGFKEITRLKARNICCMLKMNPQRSK